MSDESHSEAVKFTAPESEATAATETVNTGAPEEQEPPRSFTQEELDAKIGERLAKERRRWEREQREAAEQVQRPAATESPKPEQFKTVEEYLDALAEHKAEQKIAQREQQSQRKQLESTYAEREESAREKYADFQSVVYNDNLRITEYMAETIKASELGPDIAYHLGMNPKEATRIANLPPLQQAREIGKIEASLATNPPAVKKTSSAPDPIAPVGQRTSTPKYSTSDPRSTKTMSPSDWIEARNRELSKNR